MMIRLLIFAMTLMLGQNVLAQTCPDLQLDSDASVWNNALEGENLIPIESDTPNGAFTICNHPGVQFGLRIDERFVGPITPNTGTFEYVSPIGDDGSGDAKWNITGHLDFGYAYGAGTLPEQLADATVIMQYDCNPAIGVVNGPTIDLTSDLIGLVIPPTTVLFQITDNLGFALRCDNYGGFDPTLDGSYEFSATIQDLSNVIIAQTHATAIVGNPIPSIPLVTVTVDDINKEGWFGMDKAGAATGAITETNPHGTGNTGSLEFTNSGSPEDIINAARIPLVAMNEIDAIGYDFWSDNATVAPALKLQYWNPTRFGTLVYEPINQGAYPINTWVTVDGASGLWWSTEFGQGDKRTLAQWQADIGDIPVTFMQTGVGSGWTQAMTGHVDMVRLQDAATNTVWDFEYAAPLPPPPLEIITVTPTEPGGWFLKDGSTATGELTVNNPHGPGTLGSLEFNSDGSAGQIVHASRIPVINVDDITAVGWDIYTDSTENAAIPRAKIEYYSLGGRSGTLVYNPSAYTPGAWRTEDGFVGTWWSTEPGFGSGDPRTLEEWKTELAGIFVNYFQVGMGDSGGAFLASTSFTDMVHLQTSRFNTQWDFEGEAPLPPPPSDTNTTIVSTAPAPSIVGQSVVVNFTVEDLAVPTVNSTSNGSAKPKGVETIPTGDVTVTDGTNSCVGTVAEGNCTLTFVTVGTQTLTATYAGDFDHNPSVSAPYDHEVVKADTATVIEYSLPNPSMVGEIVTIKYAVTSDHGNPTGTVTISDGTDSCSGTVVAGSCTITYTTVGVKSLVADYAGDANFNVSTSSAASHEVVQIPTVTTITSSVPNPSEAGSVVTINYTVTGTIGTPVGNVTVGDGTDSCTGTVAAGSCTITFATVGVKSLVADYAGDVDYMASASVAYSHEVVEAATMTTITSSTPNPSTIGEVVTISYTVTATSGTPTGDVTVGDGTDSCTATVAAGSCTITFATAGVKSLVADYAGDVSFAASTSVAYSHEVTLIATVTTVAGSTPNPSAIAESVAVTYSVTAGSSTQTLEAAGGRAAGEAVPTGNVTVSDGTDSCTAAVVDGGCSIIFATSGTKSLVASYAGDAMHAPSVSAPFEHVVDAPVPALPAPPIPTLSQWALLLLTMLLGIVAVGNLRRKI